MSMDFPWISIDVHGESMDTIDNPGVSMDCPWISTDSPWTSMDCTWISIDYPWIIHGYPPWISSMDIHGYSMEIHDFVLSCCAMFLRFVVFCILDHFRSTCFGRLTEMFGATWGSSGSIKYFFKHDFG